MDVGEDAPHTAAERLILRWDSFPADRRLFDGDHRAEAERYLRAVDELRRLSVRRSPDAPQSPRRAAMPSLQLAMSRLERELSHILSSRVNDLDDDILSRDLSNISFGSGSFAQRGSEDAEEDAPADDEERAIQRTSTVGSSHITSRIWEIDLLPSDAVLDLRSIAELMVAGGYKTECFQAYASSRRAALEDCLRKLGAERLGGISAARELPWDTAEAMIRRWIRAASTAVRVFFASERRLCDLVFDGGPAEDYLDVFSEIAKTAALQLLNFPDAISVGQSGPEKLFKMSDLHDCLYRLLPDIEQVFGPDSAIHNYAADILTRLAGTVRTILSDFEAAVYRERSRTAVPLGNLHPMTRYVMNYINLIAGYKQSLSEIVLSRPSPVTPAPGDPAPPELNFDALEIQSPLGMHLAWIVAVLCSNLEVGAALYREPGLSHIFLLNNLHYVVQKVRDSSDLRELIGNDYLRELMAKYQREATSYQRAVWVNVLQCLRDEGIHARASGVSIRTLRERFRAFNTAFEEAHRTQQAWIVPDTQLKEELRIAISVRLLPAYRGFLGRYRQYIENGKHPEQYIRYTVEQLEQALGDFFEGTVHSTGRRR